MNECDPVKLHFAFSCRVCIREGAVGQAFYLLTAVSHQINRVLSVCHMEDQVLLLVSFLLLPGFRYKHESFRQTWINEALNLFIQKVTNRVFVTGRRNKTWINEMSWFQRNSAAPTAGKQQAVQTDVTPCYRKSLLLCWKHYSVHFPEKRKQGSDWFYQLTRPIKAPFLMHRGHQRAAAADGWTNG